MSEIERAMQEFEDNAYHTSMKPTISEASKAVAMAEQWAGQAEVQHDTP